MIQTLETNCKERRISRKTEPYLAIRLFLCTRMTGTTTAKTPMEHDNKDTDAAIKNKDTDVAIKSNDSNQKKNRIQVSNTKKPLYFYLNLAKRYLEQHDEVELSALGMAIPTAVIIAEILKRNGTAPDQNVTTSTLGNSDEANGRLVRKARIEIILQKGNNEAQPEASAD